MIDYDFRRDLARKRPAHGRRLLRCADCGFALGDPSRRVYSPILRLHFCEDKPSCMERQVRQFAAML